MSDVREGPGWWLASDGKWYPPHVAPGYTQPPAPEPKNAPDDVPRPPPEVPEAASSVVVLGVAVAPGSPKTPNGPDEYRVTFEQGSRRFVIGDARGAVLQFAKLIGSTVRCVGEPGDGRLVVLLDPVGGQQCTGQSSEDMAPPEPSAPAGAQGPAPVTPPVESPPSAVAEGPITAVVQAVEPSPDPGTTVIPITTRADDTGVTPAVRPVPVSPLETGEIPAYAAPTPPPRRRRFPVAAIVLILVALAAIGGITYFVRRGADSTTTTTTGPLQPGVVPVVVGQPWLGAVGEVQQVGLTVTVVHGTSTQPVGVIYQQSPPAGTHLAPGAPVVLSISQGPSG